MSISISCRESTDRRKEEAERLETLHRILNLVFDGRLVFPPVSGLDRILDLGCGAGSWAIEVANNYPQSEVIVGAD